MEDFTPSTLKTCRLKNKISKLYQFLQIHFLKRIIGRNQILLLYLINRLLKTPTLCLKKKGGWGEFWLKKSMNK